ncbi:MAG: type I-C CRISPR-associated endonuclease Cas1 [Candidatus Riflebacteria bacterium]|nr:type I-C CRISPR-associated endonuclease Cas1 [Candidatus Riflebacteria bacterium]
MRRLLNTLYVTSQGAYLAREGDTVQVRVEHQTKLSVPIHTLGGIVCFGNVTTSPFLLGLCGERNVAVSYLSEHGRFLARVEGPVSGNVLLRREQYRRADDPVSCSAVASVIVGAKIANCRTVLLRAARERSEEATCEALRGAATHMARLLDQLDQTLEMETVRGREGDAARAYFGVFDQLIAAQKDDFFFHERSRRPPLDNMNSLLSFLYTLVRHDVSAALAGVGLDPAVGFLHTDRPGRPGLALDLMEEFRPYLADRLALSLVNLQQVKGKGFRTSESGAVQMDDETRKTVLVAYQKRKQEEIQHPFLGEKVAVGLLPHVQAMLLARFLRGDLDGYPPFIWR